MKKCECYARYKGVQLSARAYNAWHSLSNCGRREPTIQDLLACKNCGAKTFFEIIGWLLRKKGVTGRFTDVAYRVWGPNKETRATPSEVAALNVRIAELEKRFTEMP